MIILILGAGACGIASMVHFLNRQAGTIISKERDLKRMAWQGRLDVEIELIDRLIAADDERPQMIHGDAAWYHLPYCHELVHRYHGRLKLVCMTRGTDDTDIFSSWAEDLAQSWGNTNPLCEATPISGQNFKPSPISDHYPKFGIGDQRIAACHYISLYGSSFFTLREVVVDWADVIEIETQLLDDDEGQTHILDMLGFPEDGRTLIPGGCNVHEGRR